ncbi:MAG: hypothetical protein E5Y63_04625 [Mesorhizobium sp.]|uniref:hypothetical protein n=1 Tax=Mesorhizobium sp. TaxID=1871066 RepID=UPI00120D83C4|nr:hypothetical protein [Mesorhizobium sp.]TIM32153.1 MAG: hypothetical protein E5Y63_04625 [Mesorhizobium sp.]
MEARDRLRHEAKGKAGLLATYPDTKEIRDVLRGMTPEDRDAAILHAVSKGDHAVIAALQAHELLVGPTSRPLKSIVDDFVAARAPEEMAKIQDLDTAEEHLTFAYQQFGKSIQAMRDIQAERDGEQGNKAAKEAEAKLGLALAAAAPAQHSVTLVPEGVARARGRRSQGAKLLLKSLFHIFSLECLRRLWHMEYGNSASPIGASNEWTAHHRNRLRRSSSH